MARVIARRVVLSWLAAVAGGVAVGNRAEAAPVSKPDKVSKPGRKGIYSDIYSDFY